jgi:ABC-type uncharacterized transport system permease subunit
MTPGAETRPWGESALPARPVAQTSRHRVRRLAADRWVARLVILGGIAIIASILAILIVIVVEVAPLFGEPTATFLGRRAQPLAPGTPLVAAIGVDEYREIAYRISGAGALEYVALRDGTSFPPWPSRASMPPRSRPRRRGTAGGGLSAPRTGGGSRWR